MAREALYKRLPDTEANRIANKTRARNRQLRAKKAAKASANVRAARAKGRRRGHHRDRQEALFTAYRMQQVNLKTFRALDVKRRQDLGIGPSERGTLTLWAEYRSCMGNYRRKGQGFYTTNGQRARALEQDGRPRCNRTVQRAHQQLRAMGLLRRAHVKRGGSRRGERDCLRVNMMSFVTPPSAAPAKGLRPFTAGASRPLAEKDSADSIGRNDQPAPPARAAPPEGGRDGPAAKLPNGNSSDKEDTANAAGHTRSTEDDESVQFFRELNEIKARDGVLAAVQFMRERREQRL
jgi:hypothetical protein